MLRIVEFDKYCPTCRYSETSEGESPCWECLSVSAREDSRKPEKYEEKGGKTNGN